MQTSLPTIPARSPRRVSRILIGLIITLVLLGGGYGGYLAWSAQRAAVQQAAMEGPPLVDVSAVAIRNSAFAQPHIQVTAGTTVTWTNEDDNEHNVAFVGGDPAAGPMLVQGETFAQTFTTPGVYQYICAPHPYMVGKVTVVE